MIYGIYELEIYPELACLGCIISPNFCAFATKILLSIQKLVDRSLSRECCNYANSSANMRGSGEGNGRECKRVSLFPFYLKAWVLLLHMICCARIQDALFKKKKVWVMDMLEWSWYRSPGNTNIQSIKQSMSSRMNKIVWLQALFVLKGRALKSTFSCMRASEFERKSNVERLVEIPIGYRNSTPHKPTPKMEGHCFLTRPAYPWRAQCIGFASSIEKAPLQDPSIATGPFTPSWASPCSWNPRAFSTNDTSFQILWEFEKKAFYIFQRKGKGKYSRKWENCF